MNRVHNFSPGPAVLPLQVLEQAREDLLNYQGLGVGIMELSHRSAAFEGLLDRMEQDLRDLLNIPEDYSIIYCTGGAHQQFSMIPMSFLHNEAYYLVSGFFAERAFEEAEKFGTVKSAGSSKEALFNYLPKVGAIPDTADYLHYTSNNTIVGTQYKEPPYAGKVPLICDASSDILHKKIDVTKCELIYAGAQKNLGPAGVTLVIIKKSFAERAPQKLPVMLDYRNYIKSNSLHNTPPVFPIYIVGEVLRWLKQQGGLDVIAERNQLKASLLYNLLDTSSLYRPFAKKEDRSVMNATFTIADKEVEARFLKEASGKGMYGIKGHKALGGFRVSMYNALPVEGVEALIEFMKDFERRA